MINDFYECQFDYCDPTLEICTQDNKLRNLDTFTKRHHDSVASTDPEKNLGEIIIHIPTQLYNYVAEGKTLVLNIEFGLEKPAGGIHFVVPFEEGSDELPAEKLMHMYTCSNENSSRMWFPSIDTCNEACTWKLEFTVDSNMTAVSCGELIETVYSFDLKKKTFHYVVSTPIVPPSIGLAVGPFEIMVDPFMHEVTHFCLPHLLPLLKDTCSFLHEAFEFYEELLSTRYPYSCYKQVFVDESYNEVQPYATMVICDTYLLHSKHIIDQTYSTRRILGQAIAEQFFGHFITTNSSFDSWLTRGISYYLGTQFYKKAFGNNQYRFYIDQKYKEVINYEQKYGGVILDNSTAKSTDTNGTNSVFHFSINHLACYSPAYNQIHKIKSMLIVRMLEDRIGRELMLQVFNKLLALAVTASQQKISQSLINAWNNMLISTSSFSKAIFTVTGKDIATFLDQWVHIGGHPKFHGNFVFNRKRNTVELEIKQSETTALGIRKYMGPLTVWVQELDGTFKHNLQIEENITKHDITCHSKSRRNKKKKIPLWTGEEIDMDFSIVDGESPVLWIRIDPEMQLLGQVVFEQPDFQWQFQLRYERDIVAQLEAMEQLQKYASPYTRKALTDIIENTQAFYRVRCQAAECLTVVVNQMANTWTGPPAMMSIFKKLFGSFSCPSIIKLNNFSNFQNYFLQKSMPLAMARLRTLHGICPSEVLHFLLDLFKYNDNSKNKFSDNYYRSALVEAIVETLTPVVSAVLARTGFNQISSEALSSETKLILDEITRYFNMEKLLPCYHYTVTVSCLKAFRHLQKMGHLPNNPKLFQSYTQYGLYKTIRVTAVEALVDIIKVEKQKDYLMFLLNLIEFDPVPSFRYNVMRLLTENPPITNKDTNNPLNTEEIVDKIWSLMNRTLAFDTRLRSACVDMYHAFYGRQRPACVPKPELSVVLNLKEQKALVHPNLQDDNSMNNQYQPSSVFRESEPYKPTLDFDQAFNKRKLEAMDTSGELDDFDEKFNKEKRFKGVEHSVEHQQQQQQSSTDYQPTTNLDQEDEEMSYQQNQDSQHLNSDYGDDSNGFSNTFNRSSSFLPPHENSSSRSRNESPTPVRLSNLNNNLNDGLEDTDAQSFPTSLTQQQPQTDQPQMSLTFSLSKQFGLSGISGTSLSSTNVPIVESKERTKEKKRKKDKDRDKDEHGSSSHKKKKKKKHKKHKSKDKNKDHHSSELATTANSSSLPTNLLRNESSQLVMSDASDSNETANTP